MFLKQLLIFSTFVALSVAVPLGGVCSPVNPLLFCNANGNMVCKGQGDLTYKCECLIGETSNQAGTLCMGSNGEVCHTAGTPAHLNCNYDRGLDCIWANALPYGICGCYPPAVFDEETAACVEVAGAVCDPGSTDVFGKNCVPHSTCDVDTRSCKCDQGFEPNRDNRCQRIDGGLGVTCNADFDCDSDILHLECNDESKTCQCATSQMYHAKDDGTCVKDFGATCTVLDPCDDHRFQRCSSMSSIPGECECQTPDFAVFNPRTLFCDAIVGQSCRDDISVPGKDCIDNAQCISGDRAVCACLNDFIPTHDNRTCRPREQLELGDSCDPNGDPCSTDSASVCSSVTNTCACPGDKSPNKAGTRCYARQGETCNEAKPCNEDRYMHCSSVAWRCICNINEGEYWDAERDSCVGESRAHCTEGSSPWDLPCTENATCTVQSNPNVRRCECNEGFSQDEEWRCSPVLRG